MKVVKYIVSILFMFVMNVSYSMDVVPISNFDISRYLGRWYEIARLPNRFEKKCINPITATYSINPDNNLQIVVTNMCYVQNADPEVVNGMASFIESATIGKLTVTFLPKWLRWLPIGYGDYWILATDYKDVAVVGSPDHKYLWILARTNYLTQDQLDQAVELAKTQGFDISTLILNYPKTAN